MAEHAHAPSAFHHVQDQEYWWHIFDTIFGGLDVPLLSFFAFGHEFKLTKFMILEVFAAGLIIAIYVPLARKARDGSLPKGPFWNCFEVLLTFVRDEIAKPTIGEHADLYVPYLWTVFLFVLFCNLLGMFPFLGSPTASIWVTGGLAAVSFVMMHGAPVAKMGLVKYLKSLWPHIEIVPNPWGSSSAHGHGDDHGHHDVEHVSAAHDTPKREPSASEIAIWIVGSIFGFGLSLSICLIEAGGTFIKASVLAVRLFANMFGGHMVLATILIFIYVAGNASASYFLWGGVTVASVLGMVALSLLELLVAFLQAYVFTFLTSLFMGMALNPQH